MLSMINDGSGGFITTTSAVAFCVYHRPSNEVEIRLLFVLPRSRDLGAGRAILAKLRSRYAGQRVFANFADPQLTRFTNRAGFYALRRDDGNWYVASDFAVLPNVTPILQENDFHVRRL